VQNFPYLFAVYTIIWIAFFIYAFFMNSRIRELKREIADLREELKERPVQQVPVAPPAPKRPDS